MADIALVVGMEVGSILLGVFFGWVLYRVFFKKRDDAKVAAIKARQESWKKILDEAEVASQCE